MVRRYNGEAIAGPRPRSYSGATPRLSVAPNRSSNDSDRTSSGHTSAQRSTDCRSLDENVNRPSVGHLPFVVSRRETRRLRRPGNLSLTVISECSLQYAIVRIPRSEVRREASIRTPLARADQHPCAGRQLSLYIPES